MKKTTGILLGLAALWVYIKHTTNTVKITFEKLTIVGINAAADFMGTTMLFDLSVLIQNPSYLSVTIDDIVGDIYLMDVQVASINQVLQQTIAARKTSRIIIPFEAYAEQLGVAMWQNIMTGDITTLTARFDGYITVKGIHIPINRVFNVYNSLSK